ncbi:hypothetical protein [Corallococcus exercitus]|uniref:Uncharacterized protein n=1 Tax=Corallococcus exercitus TaxID=2316736 RepID=A0A7Y4K244_9BACT|nr:hypothetical protein [Corallococcus exercitus]NOK14347.1 hypothetical protein [Corallococcus exercitus]
MLPYPRHMTTRRALTDLMAEVSGRAREWSSPQDLGCDRVPVTAAWLASDDPRAMMLLLAAVHPRRHEEKCIELATEMSFFETMRYEAHMMSRRRSGMNFNGRSPFYFIHLYQLLRSAWQVTEDTERSRLGPELAAAIRVVVPDPFTLVGPAA